VEGVLLGRSEKTTSCQAILDGTARMVAALSSLGEAVREPGGIPTPVHSAFNQGLGYVSRELEAYNVMADELLSLSSDIKSKVGISRAVLSRSIRVR
jgi:hypothetical protein